MWEPLAHNSHTSTIDSTYQILGFDRYKCVYGFENTRIINANNNTTGDDTMTLQQTREALANMPIEARDELLVMLEENAPQQQIDEILSAWLPK